MNLFFNSCILSIESTIFSVFWENCLQIFSSVLKSWNFSRNDNDAEEEVEKYEQPNLNVDAHFEIGIDPINAE